MEKVNFEYSAGAPVGNKYMNDNKGVQSRHYNRFRPQNCDPTGYDVFGEEDFEQIDFDEEDPFNELNPLVRYQEGERKGQIVKPTDFNPEEETTVAETEFDSTETEQSTTEVASTSSSEGPLLSDSETPTTESFNYDADEVSTNDTLLSDSSPDSPDSTDSFSWNSDSTTESSEKSYTSLSENVDDSPDTSGLHTESEPSPDEGPPRVVRWSTDEEAEVPVVDTGAKAIDPEDLVQYDEDKGNKNSKLSRNSTNATSERLNVSNILSKISKHIAPRNSFQPSFPEEFKGTITYTQPIIQSEFANCIPIENISHLSRS